MKLQNSSPMVGRVRVELTSRGGLYPALPSATDPYKVGSFLSCPGLTSPCVWYSSCAEHLIGTLSPCETSINCLPAEFEPLTVARPQPRVLQAFCNVV